jgi:ABC-type branched-subunit amino acid transport system permease subunit
MEGGHGMTVPTMDKPAPASPSAARLRDSGSARAARAIGTRVSTAPISLSLLVAAAIILLFPFMWGTPYVMRVATTIGITVVLALGLTILMGGSGEMSFAHAGFYGIGAYAVAVLETRTDISFWPTLVIAGIAGCCIGLLVGIPVLRTHGLTFTIVTLGFGLIASDVFESWTGLTKGSVGIAGLSPAPLDAVPIWGPEILKSAIQSYYLVWATVIVVVAFVLRLFRGDYGRVLRGIRGDAGLAEALGYRPTTYRLLAFSLSAGIAGLAGGLYAQYIGFVSPESFTFVVAFSAVAVVAIGGARNPWGTVIAGVVLGAIPEVLRSLNDYRLVVYAVILYFVLLARTRLGWKG